MSSKVETLIIKPNIMITYCLTALPLTPNTWLWLTLNPDFVLNCVLRQHVWSSEAWLSKQSYTCKECWRTSTEKNTCSIARFPCGSTAFLLKETSTALWQTRLWSHHALARSCLSPLQKMQFVLQLPLVIYDTHPASGLRYSCKSPPSALLSCADQ